MRMPGPRKNSQPRRRERSAWATAAGPAGRLALAVLALLTTRGAAQEPLPPPPPQRPNILLVVVDDVGIENVSCYQTGGEPAPTPTIDRLARQGLLFRCAWSNPVCSATRAGIHTGRHGFRTGVGFVINNRTDNVLRCDESTLPRLLSDAGYACGLIGKWHLGNKNNGGNCSPLWAGWSFHSGSLDSQFKRQSSYYDWTKHVNGHPVPCHGYATTVNVNDALQWIQQQHQPWFCCVAFNAGHAPWHVPPRHLHSYDLDCRNPHLNPRPFYLATLQAMDTELGRLLDGLGPQIENTTVIFVSDNGTPGRVVGPPFSPMERRFQWGRVRENVYTTALQVLKDAHRAKGTVYEAGVRVPLIVAGRQVNQPGREVTALVQSLDIFSTIIELAGVDPGASKKSAAQIDSVSLVPYLLDCDMPSLRHTLYTEIFLESPTKRGQIAIRDQRYKLIRTHWVGDVEYELYDLQRDPLEQCDLLVDSHDGAAAQAAYCRLRGEIEGLWASEFSAAK